MSLLFDLYVVISVIELFFSPPKSCHWSLWRGDMQLYSCEQIFEKDFISLRPGSVLEQQIDVSGSNSVVFSTVSSRTTNPTHQNIDTIDAMDDDRILLKFGRSVAHCHPSLHIKLRLKMATEIDEKPGFVLFFHSFF